MAQVNSLVLEEEAWCAVMHELSALCAATTLLGANACLTLRSDLCRIHCAVCLCCVWNLEFFRSIWSIRSSQFVRHWRGAVRVCRSQ